MRIQMLGLCRFSYLGLRGFQKDHASFEERRAFLYDPDRLERRWFWFQHVMLPAWLAQTDPDFTLVVMTGPDLPQPWLDRLHELAAQVAQLRVSLVPPMERHLPACMAAVAPHIDASADVVGHFRHDDDDAVAVDFIARAKADFGDAHGVWKRHGILCLDHMRGVMAQVAKGDLRVQPRMCYNMGVAQTIFLPPNVQRTALHYEHWKIGLWMPGVSIGSPLMFLRLIHGDSDSGDTGPGFPWSMPQTEVSAILLDRFRIEITRLEEGAHRFG
ncbi:putative rhamnosyl transferase [Paracoccus sp. TK19116]|uniref:Rhamnosyl transferase n=1 Tax=Paracoccus albicereus TaxID=2922394 RepID=A0ABT1MV25_9RHOB|nr:glycosyltransferase [Paracoccus albicereus]MCQ0972155.1 putative rhamnosyl transferase [Paracoccus albicereus]